MSQFKEISKEFYGLQGNTVSEKRKHLNYYIKRIKTNISSEDDLNLLTKSITPRNKLERIFKVEILLQLQRNDQLLDILKGVDLVLNAKIYKNWKFFSEVFSNMNCHRFFNDITPYISYSCTMKIITRLSKVLTNEDLADEYFNAVREKYGIHVARRIMPACSIDLVKSATQTYKIQLTSKQLLIFTKKDKDFSKFYFNALLTFNIRIRFSRDYKKCVQYIGRTDADLFWNLYDTYDFNNSNIDINLGESVFDFLFAHDEAKTSNREVCVNIFNPRRVYNVLLKRGKIDVLLANFCRGDENEFYKIYAEKNDGEFYLMKKFLDGMPKYNYFRHLNGAFKLKFGKDLLDYPKYLTKDIMETTSNSEREKILDKIIKENDDFVYLYDIKRSIPLLKAMLDKNVENPDPYLKQLYRSCKFHGDQSALLDVSRYIDDKYRCKEHLINDIGMDMVQWSNAEKFKPEIWKLIDEMVAIMEYSDDVFTWNGFTDYLHKHIINSVDNNIPFGRLFQAMLNRETDNFLNYDKKSGNVKRYCEEACKLMTGMRKKDDFDYEIEYLLSNIVEFNSNNKSNAISLLDYGHLLEIFTTRVVYYGNHFIKHGVRHNLHSSFHDLYWKRFKEIYERKYVAAYVQDQPEYFLKNMFLMSIKTVAFMKKTSFENFTDEMRNTVCDYCVDILTLNDKYTADKLVVALKLLPLINEEHLFNTIKRIDLAKLHKLDNSQNIIKKQLSKFLKCLSKVSDFLPAAVKVYKDTKLKSYLAPIHSYLYKIPLDQTKGIMKLFSENSIIRLRRLSVTLAGIFLTKFELYDWIKEMNKKETDRSVKRHLCRKAFYLFFENQNDPNWSLLKDNIDLVGGDSRCALELLSKLPLISPDYCEKYVTHSFNVVARDGDINWYKKKMLILIRQPTHNTLNITFLKDLLEEIPFYKTRTINTKYGITSSIVPKDNYYIEFLFYSSGEKQDSLLEFIFEKLKTYDDEKWSDFPDDEVFSNVYEFMRAFCKYSFMLKPQDGIVKKFYDKWKSVFTAQHIQFKLLMLEFLNLYFECQCGAKEFGKRSSKLLRTYIDRYGGILLRIYCHELEYFRHAARLDQFCFLFGFIEGKSDPLTYVGVIKMLPDHCSNPNTDEQKLEELLCILRNCNEPVVNHHLAEYYGRMFQPNIRTPKKKRRHFH